MLDDYAKWEKVMIKSRKRKYMLAAFLILLAIAVFFAVYFIAGLRISAAEDSNTISPLDWKNKDAYQEQDIEDIKVNFAEKERLALGLLGFCGKYGFRQELVIKEPTVFAQGMAPDFGMEHIRFGIYRDKALTNPIDEADAGYNFKADSQIEEGADIADYPDYKTSIQVILEPGTYYAAVYSTSPFDKAKATYVSWYDVLDRDLTLEAGKYQYFYPVPEQAYEFPFTVAPDAEIMLETAGVAGTLTLYDTDGKTVLETLHIKADQPYKESKKTFSFTQGGTYCFKLTDYPESEYKRLHYGWGELHQNWLRYRIIK